MAQHHCIRSCAARKCEPSAVSSAAAARCRHMAKKDRAARIANHECKHECSPPRDMLKKCGHIGKFPTPPNSVRHDANAMRRSWAHPHSRFRSDAGLRREPAESLALRHRLRLSTSDAKPRFFATEPTQAMNTNTLARQARTAAASGVVASRRRHRLHLRMPDITPNRSFVALGRRVFNKRCDTRRVAAQRSAARQKRHPVLGQRKHAALP